MICESLFAKRPLFRWFANHFLGPHLLCRHILCIHDSQLRITLPKCIAISQNCESLFVSCAHSYIKNICDMHTYICAHVCVCVCDCVCIIMCIYTYMCVKCVYIYLCMSVDCVYIHMYMCIYLHVCIFTYVCCGVCVWVSVCVCRTPWENLTDILSTLTRGHRDAVTRSRPIYLYRIAYCISATPSYQIF